MLQQLVLPKTAADGGVSTGNDADLHLSWSNQPLKSLNNGAFEAMLAAVTLEDALSLGLKGTADITAKTAIGNIPIFGIPFDVQSSLKGKRFVYSLIGARRLCHHLLGINNFGGTTKLSDVKVTGSGGDGGNQFIISPLKTELENPSQVSLHTVDTELPVIFNGVKIGRAAIDVCYCFDDMIKA